MLARTDHVSYDGSKPGWVCQWNLPGLPDSERSTRQVRFCTDINFDLCLMI